jgi:polyisoprenoid-binding protein YceI
MANTTMELTRTHQGRQIPRPGVYEIDPSHTTIEFVGRHLMISRVRGRFTDFEGRIHVAEVPEDSWVEATIRAASVDTAEAQRDEHLRSPDFFDVEKYPEMTFRSTGVKPGPDGSWKAHGDLTVKGVTRPVTLDLQFEGAAISPWGEERIGFSAVTEVNREDWGLTWNAALETGGLLVGPKVRLEFDVQAVRRDEA